MKIKWLKLLLCALLMGALFACALAENPSDNVSGYNPFDDDADEGSVPPTLPPTVPDPTEAPAALPAANATALPMTDPFGMGAADAAPEPTQAAPLASAGTNIADPFGTGGAPLTSAAPVVPTTAVMYVTASSAKVRTKAAEKSGTVVTLYFGDQVNVSATQGEWAQVQTSTGRKGYMALSDISQANPNTLNRQMYAQLNQVAVHRSPSTKSGRVRNLKKGDTITLTAYTSDGLWARVTDGTKSGFVPSIYLDDAPQAEGTVVWCNMGSTDVMVNPDGWTKITVLSFGQQARLVGYTAGNTIAKIRNEKGYVAYCDVNALTTADPATLSTPVYAQATGRVLSNGTGERARFYNVNKGAKLTLLGVDPSGNWALVKQGGRKLYIPYIFLGNERIGKNTKVLISNQDAPLYQSAKADAAILGTLPMGTRLNLLGGDGFTARVSTISDGTTQAVTGYIGTRYLRSETPLNTNPTTPTTQNPDTSDIAAGFFN